MFVAPLFDEKLDPKYGINRTYLTYEKSLWICYSCLFNSLHVQTWQSWYVLYVEKAGKKQKTFPPFQNTNNNNSSSAHLS